MNLSKFCPTYPHAGNVGEYEGIWPALKVISLTVGQNFYQIPYFPPPTLWGLKFVTNVLEYTRWNELGSWSKISMTVTIGIK